MLAQQFDIKENIKILFEESFGEENVTIREDYHETSILWIYLYNKLSVFTDWTYVSPFWSITLDTDYKVEVKTTKDTEGIQKAIHYIRQALLTQRTWNAFESNVISHRWVTLIPQMINDTKQKKIEWTREVSGDYSTKLGEWFVLLSDNKILVQYNKEKEIIIDDPLYQIESLNFEVTKSLGLD